MSTAAAPPDHRPNAAADPTRTLVVCLPEDTNVTLTTALVQMALMRNGFRPLHPVPRFPVTTRRTRRLIDHDRGYTSGGPLELLNLAGMQHTAAGYASTVWQYWQSVTAGTPLARPFWVFVDRYRDDPARYPLARAQRDYLAQPRLAAMRAFNALPANGCLLPTADLEALQAGQYTYTLVGQLSAVVADGVITAGGVVLTPATARLDDQLTYLHAANHYLASLSRRQVIAAVAAVLAAQ